MSYEDDDRALFTPAGEPRPVSSVPVARCCSRLMWDCRCMRECEECGQWFEGHGSCRDCYGGGR